MLPWTVAAIGLFVVTTIGGAIWFVSPALRGGAPRKWSLSLSLKIHNPFSSAWKREVDPKFVPSLAKFRRRFFVYLFLIFPGALIAAYAVLVLGYFNLA